jgi:hypothetical protein
VAFRGNSQRHAFSVQAFIVGHNLISLFSPAPSAPLAWYVYE